MDKMTYEQWQEVFSFILASYPKFNPRKGTEKAWYALLKDYPLDVVQGSVFAWVQTEKFVPSVAELRNQIVSLSLDSWEEALQECFEAAEHNYYKMVDSKTNKHEPYQFSSPFIKAMFRRFGGAQTFLFESGDNGVFRAQFRESYNTAISKTSKQMMFAKVFMKVRGYIPPMKSPKELSVVSNALKIMAGGETPPGIEGISEKDQDTP